MKIKNNQSGIAHLAAILAVVVIVAIGLVGWKVWDSSKADTNKKTGTSSSPSSQSSEISYFTVKDWGVRMPVTTVGRFSASLTKGVTGSTPDTPMSGSSDKTLEYIQLDAVGFTKAENTCANPINSGDSELANEIAQIYRHKEEDPEIQYQGTFKLSTTTSTKVKVGDWWYSFRLTGGPDGGTCIKEPVPQEYTELTSKLEANFKKLEEY